jgi:hypothetical protein
MLFHRKNRSLHMYTHVHTHTHTHTGGEREREREREREGGGGGWERAKAREGVTEDNTERNGERKEKVSYVLHEELVHAKGISADYTDGSART